MDIVDDVLSHFANIMDVTEVRRVETHCSPAIF
jgi:hypothetical protein